MRSPKISKRYELEFCPIFGTQHKWIVTGATMALHLWIRESPHAGKDDYEGEIYYGGVEEHRRTAPDGMSAPDHTDCPILHGSCWHDGTSLWASEKWIPQWQACPHAHESILDELAGHLIKRMKE